MKKLGCLCCCRHYSCCCRFDRKNLGCLWDRQHPSPYFYIAFASVVAIPATITLLCYYAIYRHVMASRRKVVMIG